LASDFQTDPVFMNVGSMDLSASHNIEQIVEVMDDSSKQARLFGLLETLIEEPDAKILVFVETKRKCDELTYLMKREGWPVTCIHGDKSQFERDRVMHDFKRGKMPILLATDVAARGLDVSDIKVVINFDAPNSAENYVHRIGRTGRVDKKGIAYTFFSPRNAPIARDLIKVLEEGGQEVPEELKKLVVGAMQFGGQYSYRYQSKPQYGYQTKRPNYFGSKVINTRKSGGRRDGFDNSFDFDRRSATSRW